jgi:hypothetical protein
MIRDLKALLRMAAPCFFICAFAHPASALDPDLTRFTGAKLAEARKVAGAQTNKVPSFVWSFFDAIRVDDWQTATNLERRINAASGRYAMTDSDDTPSPALQSALWPSISEVIGAYSEFHQWDNHWLHRFGTNVIDSIPSGSIYFGGTDPGRFIVSALVESQTEGRPFFILTQNQLVDSGYMGYLRAMYGSKIYTPNTNDLRAAFDAYGKDATERLKSGKLLPGEDFHLDREGRPQFGGAVSVMQVNGLLAKKIMEKNPSREFYIEESYQLDWMYPQLSPRGPILQLHHEPLAELSVVDIQKDTAYWKRLVGDAVGSWLNDATPVREVCDFCDKTYLQKDFAGFKGDLAFAKNDQAQKTFSKLRTAIGSVYAWRAEHAKNNDERIAMRRNADLAFRQAFVLCPYSPEVVFRYAKFLSDNRRLDDAIAVAETCERMHRPDSEDYIHGLVRSLHEAN